MQFPDLTRCIFLFSGKPLAIGCLKYMIQYKRHMIELSLVEVGIGRSRLDHGFLKTVINHPCVSVSFELTLEVDKKPISIFAIVLQNRILLWILLATLPAHPYIFCLLYIRNNYWSSLWGCGCVSINYRCIIRSNKGMTSLFSPILEIFSQPIFSALLLMF